MKRCPECWRDYYDDTLLYCLDDGNALLEGPAVTRSPDYEPATAILSGSGAVATGFPASESPTRAQIDSADLTAILPSAIGGATSKKITIDRKVWVLIALTAILIPAGYFGYRSFKSEQLNSIAVLPFKMQAAIRPSIICPTV